MSPILLLFAVALVVAQLAVQRRYVLLPLLLAACHLPNAAVLPSLTVVRLLVLVGLIQAWSAGKLDLSFRHPLDRLLLVWACWSMLSSFGHVAKPNYNPLTMSVSLAFDYLGTYLFVRSNVREPEDLIRISKCLAVMLVPLALCLVVEKITGRNVYAGLGADIQQAWVREGKVRASGPFGISILTGTAGGVCFPLMMMLRRQHFPFALVGAAACGLIVFSSASSGPYMSLFAGLTALALWRWRRSMAQIRMGVIGLIFALAILMEAPIWFLIARIDIAGGSTSWHRAQLMDQAMKHIGEWWVVGTDYTRHWMPYGIQWSADHVDITNHYISLGVKGGILLMLLFIVILFKAFQLLGRRMKAIRLTGSPAEEFLLWCVGASLFAHCVSFIGVSYFDQSYVFLFFVIGVVPAVTAITTKNMAERATPEKSDEIPFGRVV